MTTKRYSPFKDEIFDYLRSKILPTTMDVAQKLIRETVKISLIFKKSQQEIHEETLHALFLKMLETSSVMRLKIKSKINT